MKDDLIARLRLHVQEGDIECPDDLLLEAAEALEAASTHIADLQADADARIIRHREELTTLRARITPAQETAIELLQRIRGWDMMDATTDGLYWRSEIDKALSTRITPATALKEPE